MSCSLLLWLAGLLLEQSGRPTPPVLVWPVGRVESDSGLLPRGRVVQDLGGTELELDGAVLRARLVETPEGLELLGSVTPELEANTRLRWWVSLGADLAPGPQLDAVLEERHFEPMRFPRAMIPSCAERLLEFARVPDSGKEFRLEVEDGSVERGVAQARWTILHSGDSETPCSCACEQAVLSLEWTAGARPSLAWNAGKPSYAGRYWSNRNIPLAFGPFLGQADLVYRREGVWLKWQLRNQARRPLRFSLFRNGEPWLYEADVGPSSLAYQRLEPLVPDAVEVPLPLGADSGPEFWASGETRCGQVFLRGVGNPELRKWKLRIPSTWASRAGLEPLESYLYLFWDQAYGSSLTMPCPYSDTYELYPRTECGRYSVWSEAFVLMGRRAIASLDCGGFHCAVFLEPLQAGEVLYGDLDRIESMAIRWTRLPGAEPVGQAVPPPIPVEAWPETSSSAADLLEAGEEIHSQLLDTDDLPESLSDALWDDPLAVAWEAWSAFHAVSLVRPRNWRDVPRMWLRVRFDPAHGLEVDAFPPGKAD